MQDRFAGSCIRESCAAQLRPAWEGTIAPREEFLPRQSPGKNGFEFFRASAGSGAKVKPPCSANPQHFPVGNVRYPPTWGEFATGQRIRPRFSASYRVLHGKGKPFPYNRRLRMRPRFMRIPLLLPGRRDAAPYIEMLRIRRTWCLSLVLLRGAPGRRALQENPTNSSGVAVIHSFSYLRVSQSALSRSLPQRGRVSPTRATGEGERDGTATWK